MNSLLLTPPHLPRLRHFCFELEDVIRLEGNRNYTRFIKANGQYVLTCRSLCTYDERLPRQFVRVHKSHVVNCRYILSVDNANHCLLMTDGISIPISRRKWTQIVDLLIEHRS